MVLLYKLLGFYGRNSCHRPSDHSCVPSVSSRRLDSRQGGVLVLLLVADQAHRGCRDHGRYHWCMSGALKVITSDQWLYLTSVNEEHAARRRSAR
jgi:hypothetical protein